MYSRELGVDIRDEADFAQSTIVDEGSKVTQPSGRYASGLRDRPRIVEEGVGSVLEHPMASGGFGGLWDTITSAVTTAVTSAVPKAEEAAKAALAKVASGVAQDVLATPAVQQAAAEQIKTQATQALAVKLQEAGTTTMNFVTKYKNYILMGSAGLIGLYVILKMTKKRR